MYSWPKMKNLKHSFHAKVRKVEISPILIRGSFKRFEDSLGGWLEIMILMKTKLSTLAWTLDSDLRFIIVYENLNYLVFDECHISNFLFHYTPVFFFTLYLYIYCEKYS